ncbi:GNAT family N-acetyltransferase, partial [Lactobacillus sp. XV13L]|nr:GNAT family N-acetyltransferase [Lactobacillus sp. XV13L]
MFRRKEVIFKDQMVTKNLKELSMNNYHLNKKTNREQFYQLYLYSFNKIDTSQRRKFFNYRYDHAQIYGYKAADNLICGLYSLPFIINFHGVDYHMNGIGDVMAATENNDYPNAGSLLQASLEDMDAQKVPLSYLAPFSYPYYRRFGYEQIFNQLNYLINSKEIKLPKSTDTTGNIIRQPLEQALPVIRP